MSHEQNKRNAPQDYRKRLVNELLSLGVFVRGSICTLKRRCIRKQCLKCKKGDNHPTTYLSLKQQGKTTLIYLPRKIQPRVRRYIKNAQRAKVLFDKITACNVELLRLEIAQDKQ